MTGATGDLTPDDVQRDLEPGERREIEGSEPPASGATPPPDRDAAIGGDTIADEEAHL